MKILVAGSSINIGPNAWPAYLQKKLDCEIINLSLVGAGNYYIQHTIISELSERSYDLVIPFWNNYLWVDFRNIGHHQEENPLNTLNPHKHLLKRNWIHYNSNLPVVGESKKHLYKIYKPNL